MMFKKRSSQYSWKLVINSHKPVWAAPSSYWMKSETFCLINKILHNLSSILLSMIISSLWVPLFQLNLFPFLKLEHNKSLSSWKFCIQSNLCGCIFVATEKSLKEMINPFIFISNLGYFIIIDRYKTFIIYYLI